MTQETTLATLRAPAAPVEAGFATSSSYGLMKSIALDFAASDIVPKTYRGKAPNCMIALNMALRMKADPLMVMQHLYIVYGNPAWSASFLIACFNQCGRFAPIAYKFEGTRNTDDWGCRAVSSYLADGTPIEGPLVTIGIAKAEGWYGKDGSKWKTMPEQMLRYRAAAWMIRSTAPEIGMGFQTREEAVDTFDMEKDADGSYSLTMEEIKQSAAPLTKEAPPAQTPAPATPTPAATPAPPAEPTKPNAKAEMEALREQTRKLWEATGRSLEEAEQSTGLYLRQWNRAACAKVQEAAKRILSEKESSPAPPVQQAAPAQPAGTASTIFCPRVEAEIDDLQCASCQERDGCPSWE